MITPSSAIRQYDRQQQIAAVTVASMRRLALRLGNDFDAGWWRMRARAEHTLQLGRAAAIHAAIPYTSEVLAETRQVGVPTGAIIPAGFLAAAPNGAPVLETLDALPIKAKTAVAGGATSHEARIAAASWLGRVALTMLADTSRNVVQTDIIARPRVTGYVRMISAGACDRCIILAGRRYLWNQGFLRHPNCNCRHIPAAENVAGDAMTDPYEYFKSLSDVEQNKAFGKDGAQAIRDGADIYKVTNVRMRGVAVAGRDDLVKYGGQTRRTITDIYARDPNRQFVIDNLRHHGYITGPQTAGGNILGNDPAGKILAAGRGRGTYTVGGQTVTTGRAAKYDALTTGTRDPLNRATMTAAEKRLYDAHYRAQWASAGYRPNSIGANSADRGLGLRPITQSEAARAQEALRKQRALITATGPDGRYVEPDQVRDLARLLGLL